jgi:hypothetical protein
MEKTTEQLKAIAFDLIVARDDIQNRLAQINQELVKRMNEEQEKSKSKK